MSCWRDRLESVDERNPIFTEFRVTVPDHDLTDLRQRLEAHRPVQGSYPDGWKAGTPSDALDRIVRYWLHSYDWAAAQDTLNSFHQVQGELDGTVLHVIHERGQGPAPFPLLLVHGWPDSVWRFRKLIALLTDPGAHGGDPADAFDVIAPSLPGYGWSQARTSKGGAFGFGDLFAQLMAELGYEQYGAHGGDWGSSILERLARSHRKHLTGLHLTDVPFAHAMNPPGELSRAEQKFIDRNQQFFQEEGAYAAIASTRPMTPAHALNDSPAGLAAWLIEKYAEWGDPERPVEEVIVFDDLITQVMIYWTTGTIATSFQPYRDFATANAARWIQEAAKDKLGAGRTPTAFALFPHDIATPPREWAERLFDVQRWTEMPRGGHFAALEEPELLAADIREFFRSRRPS